MPISIKNDLTFICGHRKSGTTLFSNLLDGHSDLMNMPTDITLLYAYYPVYTAPEYSADQRMERLKNVICQVFTSAKLDLDATGAAVFDEIEANFFRDLEKHRLDDMEYVLSKLLNSYFEQFPQEDRDKKIGIAKETSIEIYAKEVLQYFPQAKFIQVMRDPRDNFASLRSGVSRYYSHLGEDEYKTLASLLFRGLLGMRFAESNIEYFSPKQYKVVRFEDLTQDPEEVLNQVCEFIGIPFNECLLTPSILGQPTEGNNFEGKRFSSISRDNSGRWRDRISDFEACVIEYHFGEQMERFGYTPAHSKAEQMDASREFYKWSNYQYFFHDPFGGLLND